MASDSSRPGTSTRTSVTSVTSAGLRGIRATASESWDDDFLWQHSSSSDLHLPSTASRHHQRQLQYRDKRLSTASSSSEYYARPGGLTSSAQARPHRKASSLSTSTMGSTFTQEEDGPLTRTRLSRSTSSSQSNSNTQQQQQHHGKNWASLSTTSLPEEEDEPTITLATIASRQATSNPFTSPKRRTNTQHPSVSPPKSSQLVPPSPSFFRTVSSSSWRSTTPSLASDTWSGAHTSESLSATETDNETAEEEEGEGDCDNDEDTTGNWEHLSLSPEGQLLAAASAPGAKEFNQASNSSSRRKRGRGNTFGKGSPRLALSSLFGVHSTTTMNEATDTGTPSKRLGASFFRRSSRITRVEPLSSSIPVSKSIVPDLVPVHQAALLSGQQTPTLPHRELPSIRAKEENRTVRARQSTGASSTTSTSLFPAAPPPPPLMSSPHRYFGLERQASFERIPRSSAATNESSNTSNRHSGIGYVTSFSDRLRFGDGDSNDTRPRHQDQLSPALNSEQDHTADEADKSQDYESVSAALPRYPAFLSPPPTASAGAGAGAGSASQQADRSTTSLVSNQSSSTTTFTSTSAFSNDSRVELGRKSSMPRRKLKKMRPQTAPPDTSIDPALHLKSTLHNASPLGSPSDLRESGRSALQASPSLLSPSFAFPPPPSTPQTSSTSPRITRSPTVSLKAEAGNTSETASASSSQRRSKKKLGIGSSLRRRVSRRKTADVTQADESSADGGGFLNTRTGIMHKPSHNSLIMNVARRTQPLSSSVETSRSATASSSSLQHIQDGMNHVDSASHASNGAPNREGVFSDSELLPATGSLRGSRLLAGLSKRISRDFRNAATGPERKRSVIFTRSDQVESTSSNSGAQGGSTPLQSARRISLVETGPFDCISGQSSTVQMKKHKRPLSLSGFLSRSSGPMDATRSRSYTLTTSQNDAQRSLARVNDGSASEHSIQQAPLSASVIGGFRRPSGFLHRSTASSGNIPTARALLGTSADLLSRPGSSDGTKPFSEGLARSPPVLHHRRSFNPLWRSATATVPEERPPSSLSLLSETSTVRPLCVLPTASSTATITAPTAMMRDSYPSTKFDNPPTKLRQRHLPSLSLTLVPGTAITSTPPKSAGPSFPVLSPRAMQRTHSENPYASSQSSSFRSHYFTAPSSSNGDSASTSTSKSTSLANTPGAMSRKSNDSSGSVIDIVRRVSLSDLKIPQRISNSQAKIGQDLQRVKEFKEGVEELKRLRKVYRSLVTTDRMSLDMSSNLSAKVSSSTGTRADASPSPPPVPVDTSARVDNLMTRVAMDYRKWWEIADVLINLADGAEEDDTSDGKGKSPTRERCKSEMTVSSVSPPKQNRELPSPSIPPSKVTHAEALASTEIAEGPNTTRNSSQQEGRQNVHQSSTTQSLSPPSHTLLSTPIHRKLPALSRSYSTSSLSSPTSSPATPARLTNRSSSAATSEGHTHTDNENPSTTLSERQLHILRGMLNPPPGSSFSSPIFARSAESSPARTPSITSISPRSHLFANGLVPISHFTTAGLDSRRGSSVSAFSSTSTSSSSLVSPLRRRASVKKGHVIITSLEKYDGDEQLLSVRSPSPIPDSPPFHISNMLPSPELPDASSTSPKLLTPQIRPTTSRSTSGQTSTTSQADSSESSSKSLPSTPFIRKGRLRQASRSGMFGIRDLLKTFSSRRNTLEGSTTVHLGEADTSLTSDPTAEEESVVNTSTGELTSPSVNGGQTDKFEDPQIVASSANQERTKDSDISHTNTSSSDEEEEEDWDKRSSDDEDRHQSLPRSDTQATVVPQSSVHAPQQASNNATTRALSDVSARRTNPNACGTPVRRSSSRSRTTSRARKESATSSSSLGTVVHVSTPGGVDNAPKNRVSLEAGPGNSATKSTLPSSIQAAPPEVTPKCPRIIPSADSNTSSSNASDMKLVMTSEAMPALIAKITEVKQHCATCVTELRNVTV